MGYLLKEALKTLCAVNHHWSYAIFWKFGCQNPNLLIWEECYNNLALPALPGSGDLGNTSQLSVENCSLQSGEKVHLLVNKMMLDSHVRVLGEGLVGRVAFTGIHQWIVAENCFSEGHPPEVLNEICQQFSAGIQTIAVIPILPLGVVQFSSLSKITENMGFVYDVVSLILQLGSVSSAFLSNDSTVEETATKVEVPVCVGSSASGGLLFNPNAVDTSRSFETPTCIKYSSQTSAVGCQTPLSFVKQKQNELWTNVAAFHGRHQHYPEMTPARSFDYTSLNRSMSGVAKAEVITLNSDMLMNQNSFLQESSPAPCFPPSRVSGLHNSTGNQSCSSIAIVSPMPVITANQGMSRTSVEPHGLYKEVPSSMKLMSGVNSVYNEERAEFVPGFVDDAHVQPAWGGDLFDILGADYKNQLISSQLNSLANDELAQTTHNMQPNRCMEIYSIASEFSDSAIFSSNGTNDLLEAVVCQVRHSAKLSADESVSFRTTLTNASSSSVPNSSLPYCQSETSAGIKGKFFSVPKYPSKAGAASSSSLSKGLSMEESSVHSQGSSFYGSQKNSLMESDQKGKQTNSVSTGYSKKPHETGKLSRKRLKPGENPRPRPKDRQMIQDRVKELREIVPNGSKCSIDALLERTIKHMLFLQSVMKHTDKLKQAGESKIMNEDEALLTRGNFEGGVTWAYEVGSQSMVCPIRVEDLNQPRQMLIEMICEERGLFLEIADIVRGLGLTILKGVMESRDDKIWLHFTVEANRDVTRMEIFISLVHLLEQSAKTGTAQPSEIDSENQQLCHVPSVLVP